MCGSVVVSCGILECGGAVVRYLDISAKRSVCTYNT